MDVVTDAFLGSSLRHLAIANAEGVALWRSMCFAARWWEVGASPFPRSSVGWGNAALWAKALS